LVVGTFVVAGVLPWKCPFFFLTGLPCLTCGMTRAARLALHGDFVAATRMHPLWFVVLPACIAVGVGEATLYARTRRWGETIERRWVQRGLAAIVLALVVVWVARFCGAFGGPVRGE
jgi:hypothetical protein